MHVSIKRPGYDQLIDIEVPRDEINIPSIPAQFMVDAQTGYVRLQDFAENTDRDLGRALRDLSGKGMKRLLLDLRGNPGGPLDQAIRVSNRFLPQGDADRLHARARAELRPGLPARPSEASTRELPIVVLVNRSSASASEIVSGALQDHDRALIVGETTFGKALVQSVYRISEGAGLALTTARYYTPSGRLIQRPWDGTFDEYLTYTMRDQTPNGRTTPTTSATPMPAARCTAAAASSRTGGSTGRSKASTRRGSAARSTRGSCSTASPSASWPRVTRASRRGRIRSASCARLHRGRRDARGLQGVPRRRRR